MSIAEDLFYQLDRVESNVRAVESDLDVLLNQGDITDRTRESLDVHLDKAKEHLRQATGIVADAGIADGTVWSD